jgi:hypothetical protein
MACRKALVALALLAFVLLPGRALAQAGAGGCQRFQAALGSDSLSRDDLRSSDALTCLAKALSDLQPVVNSIETAASRKEVLRAARAIRVILEERKGNPIEEFRKGDDLRAISVLTFGARSDDYDTRLNTTLVLGNVIDDTSVCVPLDHLHDPKISVNGRANLLAIVSSAVASMAPEDLGNVEKMSAYTRGALPRGSNDSLRILDNLDQRVADRRAKGPRADGARNPRTAECRAYKPLWPPGVPKMTVYSQIGSDAAAERGKYDALKRALPADAYIVPPVENMKRAIERNEVRYCNPDNKDDAQALATLLASKGLPALTVVEIQKCDPDKNRNILEVWLQTGA